MRKFKKLVLACDGEGASGKSTGAKLISKKYGLLLINSGLIYRYCSKLIIQNKPKNEILFLKKKLKKTSYNYITKQKLHSEEISKHVAIIAKNKKIREILKKIQIDFSKKYKKCCIEGRDISTKILPRSDLKFFFKCNPNIAAFRRFRELKKNDPKIKLKDVKKSLRIRNILDINRKNSPLLKHIDSVEIDTGKLDKQAMVAKMSKSVERVLEKKYVIRIRTKKK